MKHLLIAIATLSLTACAGAGIGFGTYESKEDPSIKAYYLGIGVKSDETPRADD